MNVLHICDFAPPFRGNFMEEMDSIDNALKKEFGGKNIYAFTHRNVERKNEWVNELKKDFPVYIYGNTPVEKIKLFRRIIKEHKVSIIHVHFTDLKTDLCIDIAAAGLNVKIVKHYRSSYGIWGDFKKNLGKIVYRNWFFICVAPAMSDECYINFPKCRNNVVLNPVSFQRLDNYEKLTKKDIIGTDEGILCFMLGYNYKLKGIDLAAEAVSKLREKHDIYLAVCVATHLEEIKDELCRQFGGEIPQWLRLLPPRNDIGSYYRTADICLSPSRSEGSCTAAIEETYCEKIVVASDCPGQSSYIKGYLDILWFENKNADSLKEKIEEAITVRNDSQRILKNKENTVKYYGLETYTKQIIETYKAL